VSRYEFRSALGGFFHADAKRAAAALPEGLRPLESHPGLAVLAVTVFDFHASEVGPYQELVASILVSPWAPRGESLPHAAFFPVLLATSTPASREHATERWRLPKLDRCLTIDIDRSSDERLAVVRDERDVLLRLRVTGTKLVDTHRTYQSFSADAEQLYRVTLDIEGQLSEHDEERGELVLGDHPISTSLAQLLDDPIPFREQCMDAGVERFGELVRHAPRKRPS
jgi:hypothetical protein